MISLGLRVQDVSSGDVRVSVKLYDGMDGVIWDSTEFWAAWTDVAAQTFEMKHSTADFGPRVRLVIGVKSNVALQPDWVELQLTASGKPF